MPTSMLSGSSNLIRQPAAALGRGCGLVRALGMCLVVCRDRLLRDAAIAAGLEPCAERPVPDLGRAGLPPRAGDLGAWLSCPGHPDGLADELGGAPRPLHGQLGEQGAGKLFLVMIRRPPRSPPFALGEL